MDSRTTSYMSLNIVKREMWQDAAKPITGPSYNASKVTKGVVHYTGQVIVREDTRLWLQGTQSWYLAKRGYSLGYNFAVDKDGVAWEVRGFDYRCAANKGHNESSCAVVMLVNGQEKANHKMLHTARELFRLAGVDQVVTHGSLRTTRCPGDGITAQVKGGLFDPAMSPPPQYPPFYDYPPITNKPTLRRGSKGRYVKYCQYVLNNYCNQTMQVDGIYGPVTERGVKQLQTFFGITVDGIVGRLETWPLIDAIYVWNNKQ